MTQFDGESKKLIQPVLEHEKKIKYYVHNEQVFDIIHMAHLETGHGGKHKLENNIKTKYVNITREVIHIYLELCLICKKKKTHLKKGVVVKPLIFKEINHRAQVDLIDMQTSKDGEYKFILNYQEHLTKFVCLRPLKTKTAVEVAYNLVDIFCIIGCSSVLQSDNGREFCNSVIEELKSMWPDLKIVHGKPRHSESQGSVERANRDVQDILIAWMEENNLTKWSQGLRFCQWKKNTSWHSAIKQTLYEAMFGRKAHVGLRSSHLPLSVINDIVTEEELERIIDSTEIHDNGSSETTNNTPIIEEVRENIDFFENVNSASVVLICSICEKGDGDIYHCTECKVPVHNFCCELPTENSNVLCHNCTVKRDLISNKNKAIDGIQEQAKRMLRMSEKKFPSAEVGTSVTIPLPSVDRNKGDPKNIIGVILEVTEDGLYKIGTKSGILSSLYSRNQFGICNEMFLSSTDVPQCEMSLRSINADQSAFGSQGYIKSSCKIKCTTNRCINSVHLAQLSPQRFDNVDIAHLKPGKVSNEITVADIATAGWAVLTLPTSNRAMSANKAF
ncbi:SCAN domain-containing protein 3-like [Solenopsis invicta]|uniref:SCAN domain-containing protein 3-like n=1 Tax=Solenopsis invicta TaxID=13686 RepID=UPI00193D1B2A|nr:SCAN domain-containing protein 3-like [Solenopsis invicta]